VSGLVLWLLLIVLLAVLFVAYGGAQSPVLISISLIAVMTGAALTFFLRRRRR
jgi:hypothetical protein